MEFPRYWYCATYSLAGQHPTIPRVTAWGWSSESPQAAEAVAWRRANEAVYKIQSGQQNSAPGNWYYSRTPLRENIVEELDSTPGQAAVITRNRHGVLVLNTESLFIADIDLPESGPTKQGKSLMSRLFGKAPEPVPTDDPHHPALQPVHSFMTANPQVGVRIYRTHSGFRVILTGLSGQSGAGVAAGSEQSRMLLEQLRSDPLYVELSMAHRSYRARLGPKPWRCGMHAAPRPRVPHDQPVDSAAFACDPRWIARYDQNAAGFATCRLIESVGPQAPPHEQRVVEVHDRMTQVGSNLPLA